MQDPAQSPVLIVGAGPTGLVLALWLSHFKVPVRIIDKDSGPGQTSRAMGVQAHTLESYQTLGFADEVIAEGIIARHIHFRRDGKEVAGIDLSRMGKDLSPYPYMLCYPQDDHEKLLLRHLQKAGVDIERNTELVSLRQDQNAVYATLKKNNATEEFKTLYLCGCDGASSTTRMQLQLPFAGGTYSQIFYVADVMASGDAANGDLQLCIGQTDFCMVLPVRRTGSYRMIGIVPGKGDSTTKYQFSDVEDSIKKNTRLTWSAVNWFSTYHCHHRVAQHFQRERIFLLGDAAHIHSPAGGQGMNTGIGDAINLAWKLAAVLQGSAPPELLTSYEIERMAFANRLVATTDKAFQLMTNQGWLGNIWRNFFVPHCLPLLFKFSSLKRFLFKTISQVKINYRQSPVSKGRTGEIHGGDRLPWVTYGDSDNFKSLQLTAWQVHVYGEASADFKAALKTLGLPLQEFVWNEQAQKAGLEKNAFYLLRPDSYIAYAEAKQDGKLIEEYLQEHKLVQKTKEP
jgi:2-polyprenyl-6-methoxyphenol hydroxylase-like FAD-dependent oxidoreductase